MRPATITPGSHLHELQRSGMFVGGSEIGGGLCARKQGQAPGITEHLGGYIRINAATTFGHGCPATPPQVFNSKMPGGVGAASRQGARGYAAAAARCSAWTSFSPIR